MNTNVSIALALIVSSVLVGPAIAAQPEPAVQCNEGVINEPVLLAYGDHTEGCGITPPTEVDRFRFVGTAGDVVRIVLQSHTGNFDPLAELREPGGELIDTGECNGGYTGGRCSFVLDTTLPTSGTYHLAISDIATNEPGDYTLQIDRLIPALRPVPLCDDPIVDSIEPATDTDFYQFAAKAGTGVRISVRSLTGNFDPLIEVRKPSGELVETGECNGGYTGGKCTFTMDLTPTSSGTYSLSIVDIAANEPGEYEITLTCLFGACPACPAAGGIEAIIEAPTCRGVSGISTLQGIVYTTEPGAEIERLVNVIFDEGTADESAIDVPCCSSRGDAPVLLSGFAGVFNWCLLDPGLHTATFVFTSSSGKTLRVTREFVSHCEHPQDRFVSDGEFEWRNAGDNCDSEPGGAIVCKTNRDVCDGEVRYEWVQALQGMRLQSDCVPDGRNPPTPPACSNTLIREEGSVF